MNAQLSESDLARLYASDPQKVCEYMTHPFNSGSLPDSQSPRMFNTGRQIAQAFIAGHYVEAIRLMKAHVEREAADEARYDAADELFEREHAA